MAITRALFDFSGTPFRVGPADRRLGSVLDAAGARYPAKTVTDRVRAGGVRRAAGRCAAAAAARAPRRGVGPRGLAPERHRWAYTGPAREAELPDPAWYEALYERHMRPEAWAPYPDAVGAPAGLRERGAAVGVVSDIGRDPRPVSAAHGLGALVDAYVLSYEHRVRKPDARLFRVALEALGGVAPGEALMVGGDRDADGGAARLGCAVHFVDHLPVAGRPAGLRPVLDLVG